MNTKILFRTIAIFGLFIWINCNLLLAQDFVTVNKSVTVLHVIESSNENSDKYYNQLKRMSFGSLQDVYENKINQNFLKISNDNRPLGNSGAINFLQEKKVPNDILNYLLNEDTQGTLSLDRVIERAENETTEYNEKLAGLKNKSITSEADFALSNRILNSNYLLMYHHYGLTKVNIDDSVKREKGYRMKQDLYLIKLSFADTVLNSKFFENGWVNQGETDESKVQMAQEFRRNMTIPMTVESLKKQVLSSVWSKIKDKEAAQNTQSSDTKLKDLFSKNSNTVKVVNVAPYTSRGSYNDPMFFSYLLKHTNPPKQLAGITERLWVNRAVVMNTKPLRVNIGRQQGLRTNHRYMVKRTITSKKTGVQKEKNVGTILATANLSKSSRGSSNKGNYSEFKQTYGGKIKQFDKVYYNKVITTLYGGYGTSGVNIKADFYTPLFRKLKFGQKFYVDFNVKGSDQPESNVDLDVNVISIGGGLAKEWYLLKRFIAGPYLGIRFFSANFTDEDIASSLLTTQQEENYGRDLALEVGFRFGLRITSDISVVASASYNTVDFDDPFVDGSDTPVFGTDNGIYPLNDYNTTLDFTIRYEIGAIKKK